MYFAQILLTALVYGIQILMMSSCLFLIHTVARFFHVFLAEVLIGSAYGYYTAVMLWGWPIWAGVLCGLSLAVILSVASFYLIRPLIKRRQPLMALLASITLGVLVKAVIALIWGSDGKFLVEGVLPTVELAGLRISQVGIWTIAVGVVVAIAAYIGFYLLPHGRTIRAIAQHPETATLVGIKEKRVQLAVFVVTGLICGIMGILMGINKAIVPHGGFNVAICGFIVLLVGGVNDYRGTVLAALLISLIPEIVISGAVGINLSDSWYMLIVFVLAVILLILRPNGLLAPLTRKS